MLTIDIAPQVNLYGSGGFDKSALKKVEVAGGLSAKGYIPVMSIGDEVIRESSVLVERVAKLSASTKGATSLVPEQPELSASPGLLLPPFCFFDWLPPHRIIPSRNIR